MKASGVTSMDLIQVKNEISELGKMPAAEKMYPITSDWVPVTDVLAIINRFEKYWAQQKKTKTEAEIISRIFGEP